MSVVHSGRAVVFLPNFTVRRYRGLPIPYLLTSHFITYSLCDHYKVRRVLLGLVKFRTCRAFVASRSFASNDVERYLKFADVFVLVLHHGLTV